MSEILGAIASAFSWTFPAANSAVTLVLGGLIGQVIRILFSWIGKPARDRKQEAERKQREADREADRQFLRQEFETFAVKFQEKTWKSENPGQIIPEPLMAEFSQRAQATSSVLFASFGARAGMSFEAELTKGRSGTCKGCGKIDVLNAKGYCSQCQQKLPPDGGP